MNQPTRRLCPSCQQYFTAPGSRTHCTPACKTADWRKRNPYRPAPEEDPPADVYECIRCERRYQLDLRSLPQCSHCGGELRRLGIGGHCPCCDQPVAAIELLDNQEVTTTNT